MLYSRVLLESLIRTLPGHRRLSTANSPRPSQTVNPLESALPKNRRVTPLESALPNSLDLKSFRIRTYKKGGGSDCLFCQACEGWFGCGKDVDGVHLGNAAAFPTFPQRCGGWSIKKAKQEHMLLGAGVLPELWH